MNDSIILEARELVFWQRVRRGDSKVWHLADDLFTEAVKAYLAGVSHAKVRAMLEERGIAQPDLPSKTGWSNFWQRFKPFLRLARRQAAVGGVNASAREARQSPADFEEATLDLIRQLTFELAHSFAPDPEEIQAMFSLLLKYKDRQLRERLVEVAERRVVLAEASQGLTGPSLTGGEEQNGSGLEVGSCGTGGGENATPALSSSPLSTVVHDRSASFDAEDHTLLARQEPRPPLQPPRSHHHGDGLGENAIPALSSLPLFTIVQGPACDLSEMDQEQDQDREQENADSTYVISSGAA